MSYEAPEPTFAMPEARRVLRVGDAGVWPSGRSEVAVVLRREDVRTREQREALVAWFRGLLLSGASGFPFPVVVDPLLSGRVVEVRDDAGRLLAREVLGAQGRPCRECGTAPAGDDPPLGLLHGGCRG